MNENMNINSNVMNSQMLKQVDSEMILFKKAKKMKSTSIAGIVLIFTLIGVFVTLIISLIN